MSNNVCGQVLTVCEKSGVENKNINEVSVQNITYNSNRDLDRIVVKDIGGNILNASGTGEGSFGKVFKYINKGVAVKVPKKYDEQIINEIKIEVDMINKLRQASCNVVSAIGKFYNNIIPYVVMDYMDGSLDNMTNKFIRHAKNDTYGYYNMALVILLKIINAQICLENLGLGYSDMKPENTLYKCTDKCFDIKFGDVGGVSSFGRGYTTTYMPFSIDNNGNFIGHHLPSFNKQVHSWQFGIMAYFYLFSIPLFFSGSIQNYAPMYYDFRNIKSQIEINNKKLQNVKINYANSFGVYIKIINMIKSNPDLNLNNSYNDIKKNSKLVNELLYLNSLHLNHVSLNIFEVYINSNGASYLTLDNIKQYLNILKKINFFLYSAPIQHDLQGTKQETKKETKQGSKQGACQFNNLCKNESTITKFPEQINILTSTNEIVGIAMGNNKEYITNSERGASGKVFLDKKNKLTIKVPLTLDSASKLKIQNEIKIIRNLESNCNQIISAKYGYYNEIPYILMELFHGSLDKMTVTLGNMYASNTHNYYNIVYLILNKIIDAQLCLNKSGYGHSDMKPDNILYNCTEKCFDIKLGDIGAICKMGDVPYNLYIPVKNIEGKYEGYNTFDEYYSLWQVGILMYFYLYKKPDNSKLYTFLLNYDKKGYVTTNAVEHLNMQIQKVKEKLYEFIRDNSNLYVQYQKMYQHFSTKPNDKITTNMTAENISKLKSFIVLKFEQLALLALPVWHDKNNKQSDYLYPFKHDVTNILTLSKIKKTLNILYKINIHLTK